MLYGFARGLLSPFLSTLYRLRVVGAEHIPSSGKVILCCNHRSVMDPCLLGAAVKQRQIFYMAKSELFTKRWDGLLRRLGAFPVQRDSGDAGSVRTALSLLRDGNLLGIFPQGRCVPGGVPFAAKSGVAMLAAKSGADVLPASIFFEGDLKPFRPVTIRFGRVLPASELHLDAPDKSALQQACRVISGEINRLLEEKH